jgi:hypothetical protein
MACATLTVPPIGTLQWRAEYGWWEAHVTLPSGGQLDVILNPGDEDREAFAFQAAARFQWALDNERRLLGEAADAELLELFNDDWRQGDEGVLARDEFIAALKLELLEISHIESAHIEFSYNAGELFGGHTVTVQVDGEGRFCDTDLRG